LEKLDAGDTAMLAPGVPVGEACDKVGAPNTSIVILSSGKASLELSESLVCPQAQEGWHLE